MPTGHGESQRAQIQALQSSTSSTSNIKQSQSDGLGRIRLHITPLSPSLLSAYLPPSTLALATDISFHTVLTFPEKSFGYVELPTMEAQKLKKKLHGSILKGSKIRVETAKPEKRKAPTDADADAPGEHESERKSSKRVKRKEGVLPGFELPDDRRVKRGWTEPASRDKDRKVGRYKDRHAKGQQKKSQPSKYIKEPELLFRTKVPPNAASIAPSTADGGRKSRKSKSSRDVVVHEFSNTTKHASFLKGSQTADNAAAVADFIEGKGWVDAEGNVIEADKVRQSSLHFGGGDAPAEPVETKSNVAATADEDSQPSEKLPVEDGHKPPISIAPAEVSREAGPESEDSVVEGSSVVSSDSSIVSSDSGSHQETGTSSAPENEDSDEAPTSSMRRVSLTPKQSQSRLGTEQYDASRTPQAQVHPLEALFKQTNANDGDGTPKLPRLKTSFSFFGDGELSDASDHADGTVNPHTPFTRQDLKFRGVRSAAPTPDTAAISRRFSVPWRDEEDEDGEDDETTDGLDGSTTPLRGKGLPEPPGPVQNVDKPQSDFAKAFWEERGELNRSFKRARREAKKQQRQRENRRLGRRII